MIIFIQNSCKRMKEKQIKKEIIQERRNRAKEKMEIKEKKYEKR